jgi:hypothetical protein
VQLGLRSWLERHVGGSPAQFLEVIYDGPVGLDCPVVLQYCSVLPWLQIGFPESLRQWEFSEQKIHHRNIGFDERQNAIT